MMSMLNVIFMTEQLVIPQKGVWHLNPKLQSFIGVEWLSFQEVKPNVENYPLSGQAQQTPN